VAQRARASVFVTEWNSSALVKAATKAGKKKNALTPMTFSLLHATDFADRLMYKIIPPLKAGMIVLADRYSLYAFARDAARSVDRQWVRDLYTSPSGPIAPCTSACRSIRRSTACWRAA
jgi:dTMP kinase